MAGDSLPKSAISRGMKLATLPVGLAGRATVGAGKRLAGTPADAVLLEVQRRTAEQVFSVLGQLKGGAMKFGQAMSVLEAAVPEEFAGPFREVLTKLQDAAPPMPASMVHQVLAEEFGERWRDDLVELSDVPTAAASIGQVHRGRWVDGREVAVKVQYPGAAKALQADLRQIGRLARLFGVIAPYVDVKPLVKELQERVSEELDYSLEATSQARFAREFRDHPTLYVPPVVAHADRALVTAWMESPYSLAEVIRSGSQEDRDHFGGLYAHFLFSGPARVGLLHADPHPGNFRVLPDRRLGVVDFGAVAHLPQGVPPIVGQLLRHAVDGDFEAVTAGLRTEGFLKGPGLDAATIERYLGPFIEPAREETFTFSREWMRQQAQRVSAPTSEGLGLALRINLPREYLLLHRTLVGGVAVLSQLGATAPFRAILEENLPGFSD